MSLDFLQFLTLRKKYIDINQNKYIIDYENIKYSSDLRLSFRKQLIDWELIETKCQILFELRNVNTCWIYKKMV